jgi:hypothetical protein
MRGSFLYLALIIFITLSLTPSCGDDDDSSEDNESDAQWTDPVTGLV